MSKIKASLPGDKSEDELAQATALALLTAEPGVKITKRKGSAVLLSELLIAVRSLYDKVVVISLSAMKRRIRCWVQKGWAEWVNEGGLECVCLTKTGKSHLNRLACTA